MLNMTRSSLFVSAAATALALGGLAAPAFAAPVKNIVLVHGAFVDGSGWRPVYDILTRDGYTVSVVQQPLAGLAEDVAATKRILDRQNGPAILVGHSYGGAIITEAGTDPHVAGLVYIAAHAPDAGENEAALAKATPAPGRDAIQNTDGYLHLDPARFHAEFAADMPAADAAFAAQAQMWTLASAFTTPIAKPAWRVKPSWYMVAKADRIISPDLERMYAARAKSHTVEVEGASHSVYQTHPREVAQLIEDAATHAAP